MITKLAILFLNYAKKTIHIS